MSAIVTYALGGAETSEVKGIEFGLLTEAEIKRLSVAKISEASIYSRGAPTPHGVLDHRLGTVDRRMHCGTCGHDVRTCAGHWGSIHLPVSVFHVAFTEVVRKTLSCICIGCARVRLSDADMDRLRTNHMQGNVTGKARLVIMYNASRTRKVCNRCGTPCPQFQRPIPSNITIDWSQHDATSFSSEEERSYLTTRPFNADVAREILDDMEDEDLIEMGFDPSKAHPRDMIIATLLVPPPLIRPSIMVSEGSRARGQDDLTVKLQDINKRTISLKMLLQEHKIDSPEVNDMWTKLSYDISSYIHNNPRGTRVSTQRSGIPTKCLIGRLKGKTGRFRGNLMGKRVNYSGRSVISPDPLIDIDEVGVPEIMAAQLTIQERVTRENYVDMARRVALGAGTHEGAESIITSDGTAVQLEFCSERDKLRLEEGWIVERYLRDGDWIIFNRQPSLHRNSLMGHRVVVMKGKTLRVNLAVVGPYNADFDGDEMNLHVPQSPAAMAEVRGLMSVTQQVISPQAGKPVMGIVQDSLLGSYLISHVDTLIDRGTVMSIMVTIRYALGDDLDAACVVPPAAIIAPQQFWTGKQMFDLILPNILNMNPNKTDDIWNLDEEVLCIRGGSMLNGIMTKGVLGATNGGIIHNILRSCGNKEGVRFMGDAQRVVNRWLVERGFSVGIGDCVASKSCDEQLRESIEVSYQRIDTLHREMPQWSSAVLEGAGEDGGRTSLEKMAVERTVHRMVSKVQMNTGALLRKEMNPSNALKAMVTAGSKGNNINICQIMLCVGQNCVNGARLAPDGKERRTLPRYAKGAQCVPSGGFVSNSYVTGLRASEAFYHAKGGREGLVDTAVKTSKTGYIQRRLVKGMESHRTEHDLSVRDSQNNIVQFIYGADGVNPVHAERVRVWAYEMGDAAVRQSLVTPSDMPSESDIIDEEHARILSIRQETRESRMHILNVKVKLHTSMAVDPRRVLRIYAVNRKDATHDPALHPDVVSRRQVFEDVQEIMDQLMQLRPPNASCALRLALAYELRTKVVVKDNAMTHTQWANTVKNIKTCIRKAYIDAGEMVGCIAAQSIGEPATQMTLNTFHLAGVAVEGRSQLSGIPRVSEITDATKNIKTSRMILRIRDEELLADREQAEVFARSLEHCPLSHVISTYEIVIDSDPYAIPKHEEDLIITAVRGLTDPPGMWSANKHSSMVLRLTLNRRVLKRRGMKPSDVLDSILMTHGEELHGCCSSSTAIKWILRLRATNSSNKTDVASIYAKVVQNTIIGGMTDVELAEIIDMPIVSEDPESHALREENELCIETAGSLIGNMVWVRELDWGRCITNDIMDAYETLGIQAARTIIFQELKATISEDGSKVSDRHIMLVALTMTQHGIIMPMSRHGINRIAETGPLLRCSFEETSDVLADAGMFAEKDNMRGISQSIMLGQTTYMGTGVTELLRIKENVDNTGMDAMTLVHGVPDTISLMQYVAKSRFRGIPSRKECALVPKEILNEHSTSEWHDQKPAADVLFSSSNVCEKPYEDDNKGCWETPEMFKNDIDNAMMLDEESVQVDVDSITRQMSVHDYLNTPFELPSSP